MADRDRTEHGVSCEYINNIIIILHVAKSYVCIFIYFVVTLYVVLGEQKYFFFYE